MLGAGCVGMGKKIAILQSSYIPWRGYFDIMDRVDEFILLDDVQFTMRDWRSRNRVKTANGTIWLTIPIRHKGRRFQTILEAEASDLYWSARHWRTIEQAYARAPYFDRYRQDLASCYQALASERRLSAINHRLLVLCRDLLGIATPITWSHDRATAGARTDRLVALCAAAGAEGYLSGPSARDYIEPQKFAAAGIALEYISYESYRPYPQLHGAFDPFVSIVDLLLNTGPQAIGYLRSRA